MGKKIAIIGGGVGDEGKAKIETGIEDLAVRELEKKYSRLELLKLALSEEKPIMGERFQGGGNAGHTIVVRGIEYKLHQVPAAITNPFAYGLMGAKTFLDPRRASDELVNLVLKGVKVKDYFGIASNAQVTLDFHTRADRADRDKKKHTSTGSGIKQTASDLVNRIGIRFVEFLDPKLMKHILQGRAQLQFGSDTEIDRFVDSYAQEREILGEFLALESEARKKHGKEFWIGEGAQGAMLDMYYGLWPGVTSSSPVTVPNRPDTIIAAFKAYISSVGNDRSFVPQMDEKLETKLRKAWGEFGTTTGLPRDLGWFDIVAGKYALDVSGADYVAITCGDRLEEVARIGEKVQLVVGYKIGRQKFDVWNPSFDRRDTLLKAKPIHEEFEPWENFTEADGQTLTPNAQRYVDRIQELLDKEVIMLGTGPGEKDLITYRNPLID